MSDFCHLHCHTSYSLLDGAARIDSLVGQAKKLGMDALGISDHGNLYGVPEFYSIAKRNGIRPVIGCEFYLCASPMRERADRVRYHQILWAKNETGYRNLIKLSSLSFLDGFYFKPRIDFDLLSEYREGLVASTCCLQGQIPQAILNGDLDEARELLKKFLDLFGTEDYYVEIQNHGIKEQALVNETLLKWAAEFNLNVVATNDVHYVMKEDAFAQDILLCLQTGKDLDDPRRLRFDKKEFYLKSANEMRASLGKKPDTAVWMENSLAIAEKCQFDLPMGNLLMPHFQIPDEFGDSADKYLEHMVFERGRKRYPEFSDSVQARLRNELGIIREMGYAGYFLIVQDFTTAAREMGVSVGPGRGSAAGSAVAYSLGITNVDPLKYDLLFERFLNPERISMPDIDIDFDDHGRAKVIDYVIKKYGKRNVSQIVTFGTMGARTVIRDVARVLRIPLQEADKLAKSIPFGTSLEEALKSVPELKELRKSDRKDLKTLIKASRVLEGCARHTGVHAAGVIIAPGLVSDYIPVSTTKNKDEQVLTTQYSGDWVEDFGLLKMDFLGLSTLTIINDTCKIIQDRTGNAPDMDALPLDDARTFELFQRADTNGIFQFESDGMRKWLEQLKPTSLDDLIAMNALYRPGPMDLIPSYIKRKHGDEPIEYPHEILEPVLKSTYGLPVFQEQVMQMAQVMGGYSLGAADILRRAMGKKKKSVMSAQRSRFVEGAKERGIPEATAEEVFDMMDKFAGYGFNKCVEESTLIMDARTGSQTTVRQLHEEGWEGFQVYALTCNGALVPRDVEAVHYNGFKQVFELVTRNGRRIRTTSTHRFRIQGDWQRLGNLRTGDQIATLEPESSLVSAEYGREGTCVIDTGVKIIWDSIAEIIPAGHAHTYDLTVAEDHNYIANGFVVHNSHSVAYSLVAYQTAYLKAHHTAEFMAAVLSHASGDSKRFISMLDEARRLGLQPQPPSVTHSREDFSVDESGTIHFGLSSVKGVARTAVDHIVASRDKEGPAESLFQFVKRLDPHVLNRKSLESLARVGALDRFGEHRAQIVEALDLATNYAEYAKRDEDLGQGFLFAEEDSITERPEPNLPLCEKWSHAEILAMERELAGFYISGHPLDGWEIEQRSSSDSDLAGIAALASKSEEKPYRSVCGVITLVKPRKTRKGDLMSSAMLEDRTGQAELVCFPSVHAEVKDHLKENVLVMASGEIEESGGSLKILVRRIIPLSAIRGELLDNIVISPDFEKLNDKDLNHFIRICKKNPGEKKLFFKVKEKDQELKLISENTTIEANSDVISTLASTFGAHKVHLEWKEKKHDE
ncbi:MAG: DNA polymerase III subunit alpha [Rhodothermaceae bacterium]|nr:DNA polymerase III subunit alpha [Rhodothermaceae bacterium]MXZ57473.1 DNA polymerase III subunit alpha [Rhodothermaceae bacterium]MYB90457.1 DNA polymerase III subunit alpha [Rhodothermaceae bacterium]MYD68236.1 DNA polymerase III subunit alpha [Rhodothermaceae bacterium]MYG44227.1 DNA polymerase III subunit alpha [Rhodothermaceae bacterium]